MDAKSPFEDDTLNNFMLSRSTCEVLVDRILVHARPPLDHVPRSLISCLRRSYFPAGALPRRSSSSSTRWKARQSQDHFARDAKVQGLKSRAAFKLLEINDKHKLFRKGDTVIDLGYAPGSWSQVAVNRTAPNGRVIGIDIIPAQPPKGASSIQGNFLSPAVQAKVRAYVQDPQRGRPRGFLVSPISQSLKDDLDPVTSSYLPEATRSYLELEKKANFELDIGENISGKDGHEEASKAVDVVLSDMSEPWEQTTGFWKRSISDPYLRMMNTSGISFKDHTGSMDLCMAALTFCYDNLRKGGHFLCKFYQGAEDKKLEKRLKRLFEKVYREKPESSRKDSKEAYFVALRRLGDVERDEVLGD